MTLHRPQKDSPSTFLKSGIDNDDTTIVVADNSIFQNINTNGDRVTRLTIGFDGATTETVDVESYDPNNEITIIRSTPSYSWAAGTKIARVFTSYDLSEIHQNLEELNNNIINLTEQDREFNNTILGQKKHIYRGAYLGDYITESQNMAIEAGTFDELYIGDYWRLNSVTYRIADFNYWTHGLNSENPNHVVLIPDYQMGLFKMHESESASLYFDTALREYLISTILPLMDTIFEGKLCNHSENLPSILYSDNLNVVNSKVEIMSESQVYGQGLFREREYQTYSTSQFALFKIAPRYIYTTSYWLRDRCDNMSYSAISNGMSITKIGVQPSGFRPAIAISGSII